MLDGGKEKGSGMFLCDQLRVETECGEAAYLGHEEKFRI